MEYVIGAAVVLIGIPILFAAGTRREGQAFSERMGEVGDAVSRGGDRLQKAGWALTLGVTLPLAGFVIFGLVGLVVGLLIGLGLIGSVVSGK